MALRRAAFAVPLLVVVSAALFALASRSPFDPLAGYLGDRYTTTSDADRARLADELGLRDPWWATYGHWVRGCCPATSESPAASGSRSRR